MRNALLKTMSRLRRDEKGASMVEYAIALLVVAAIGVTTFSTMGTKVAENSTAACRALAGSATAAGC